MEREPDPLTAGVAQDQEAGLSSTGMVSIRRDVLDGTLKGGEGDGGIIMRPLPDTPCIRHWRPRASTNSAPSSRGIRNRRHRPAAYVQGATPEHSGDTPPPLAPHYCTQSRSSANGARLVHRPMFVNPHRQSRRYFVRENTPHDSPSVRQVTAAQRPGFARIREVIVLHLPP